MIRGFEYIFYRLYAWQTRTWSVGGEISAVIVLSVLVFFNALAALAVTEGILRRSLVPGGLTTRWALIFTAVLFGLQYFGLFYTGRYKTIVARFSHESPHEERRGKFIVLLYAVSSLILLICSSIFRANRLHT